ncbi:archaellin/type IV pilin N-terminal domain-containing protein [Halorhabdus sp. CUG00001]|uniref:archaellin/type IV pilin N-terminal domain-containing protein n=1 Tax=Halorhabdus sp. CUG00001 TaxID=2600297 RepID=UPI00131B31C6|nr:archaellin/type IV pilin N-terminal domain-containing protein [Halorhabdus sp. CUG00001]
MFERNDNNRNERAQVGIGTLIVFIAMVLVAAIAAGVLINTAGFLQSSAEESGEQAAEQVTNRLVEVNTVGNVSDAGTINEVNMTVRLAPGSNDVNLNDTTIQWVTTSESSQFVSDRLDNTQYATFNWSTLRDDANSIQSDDTLNDPVDRAILDISLGNGNQPGELDAGGSVEVQIDTRSGGQTSVTLVVPDSLSGKSSVSL